MRQEKVPSIAEEIMSMEINRDYNDLLKSSFSYVYKLPKRILV